MIAYLINWLIWNIIQSLVFTSLALFAVYWFYIKKLPKSTVADQPQYEEFKLENTFIGMIDRSQDTSDPNLNSMNVLNLLLQFFFQELKDTKAVRRYLIKRITLDFQDLLTTKAAGKFIERLSTRDFSLGTSFPIVNSVKCESYKLDSTKKLIDEVSVLVDIEYKNGFSISVDADLILGKSAYVHIKVALIKGKIRLQFCRQPFTHWSFAFVEDPIVEMEGSSQFDGRSMPKLTYLLVNQIRKSIRRKHTLPNYKIRFKPFFEMIYNQKLYKSDLNEFLAKKNTCETKFSECAEYTRLCQKLGVDLSSVGTLKINLKSCDRLPEALYSLNQSQNAKPDAQLIHKTASTLHLNLLSSSPSDKEQQNVVHLTTSIDSHSMEKLMDKRTSRENWPFIEFEIQKTNANQMIGIVFMEVFFINKTEICIQKINEDSLAGKIKTIKKFDILYSINQVRCTSVKTLNKLIQKSSFQPIKFVVQRPIIVSKKPIVKMSNFPMRLSSVMDEETSENEPKISSENLNVNTSASSLVDFYCNVTECALNEPTTTLDLVALLTDLDQDEDKSRFKKTSDLKLDKENLFSLTKNRVPIQIDESFEFDLSEKAKYLNVVLWSEQSVQKSSRKKPLPIGFVTIALNELAIDCWSTTKGESQSTFYFKPIEELRASAVSKMAKSHVISDHLGFESNVAIGNLTINFQHFIEQKNLNKKDISAKIAQEIIDKSQFGQEKNQQSSADISESGFDLNSENDDGSVHKFLSVQFNQILNCEICKKKIWFKTAYKCAYCGFIIHQKCYENAINKTICQRFFAQNPNLDPQEVADEQQQSEWTNDDSFVILSEPESAQCKTNKRRSRSPSDISVTSTLSDGMIVANARAKVTSFFNGLRQRNLIKSEAIFETKSKSTSNLLGYIKKKKDVKPIEKEKMDSVLDENLEEEFKDIDPTDDDKLFGTELFEDLEESERKTKYEEQIAKYQNTVDMMSKLKTDLEAEMELIQAQRLMDDKKQVTQQENAVRSQINHLNEQIKCVMFLLMQCKMGLESLAPKDQQLPEPIAETTVSLSSSETSNSSIENNNVENLQLI